jgi:hypothetical protein
VRRSGFEKSTARQKRQVASYSQAVVVVVVVVARR